MKAAQKKLIAALEDELAAAIATKEVVREFGSENQFDSACARVRDLELEISIAHRPTFAGCKVNRALAVENRD